MLVQLIYLEEIGFKKFLGLPNWTRPTASSNLAVLGIFFIQLFPNWTACSPMTHTNCTPSPQIELDPVFSRAQ